MVKAHMYDLSIFPAPDRSLGDFPSNTIPQKDVVHPFRKAHIIRNCARQ